MKTSTRVIFFILLVSMVFTLAAFGHVQRADRFMLPAGCCQACLDRMAAA